MNCQCCGSNKARLRAVPSNIIKGNQLLLCTQCLRDGHEPRHFVIMGAHSGKDVRDLIKGRKYCGESLEAHEVIV